MDKQNKKQVVTGTVEALQVKKWLNDLMTQWPTKRNSGAYIGGVHLFPFRTEKLSPPEPMVLQ